MTTSSPVPTTAGMDCGRASCDLPPKLLLLQLHLRSGMTWRRATPVLTLQARAMAHLTRRVLRSCQSSTSIMPPSISASFGAYMRCHSAVSATGAGAYTTYFTGSSGSSPATVCFALPHPRSRSMPAAVTRTRGSGSSSAATSVSSAQSVYSRARASMPFGRPDGLPDWPGLKPDPVTPPEPLPKR